MADKLENAFFEYTYKKVAVWSGVYRYDLEKDDEVISTPGIHSANENDPDIVYLLDHVKNFRYYVDEGRDAWEGIIGNADYIAIEETTGLSQSGVIAEIIDILGSDEATAEKIVDILETLCDIPFLPNSFLVVNIVLVIANRHNCKTSFAKIKTLV